MSGHSHWAGIKHKKGLADAKRSQVFSKLAKEITIAAKEGADPNSNSRLRSILEKAKSENMPSDNIERAIKKAVGEDASQLQELLIEAYGPEGIAILISAITDNRNRTIGEIKQILQKNQGKMVEGGGVQWLFERKGVLSIDSPEKKEKIELLAIENGADDFYWRDASIDIYTSPANMAELKEALAKQGVAGSTSLDWIPKERVVVSESAIKAAHALFESLDAHDDVQDIYSTL